MVSSTSKNLLAGKVEFLISPKKCDIFMVELYSLIIFIRDKVSCAVSIIIYNVFIFFILIFLKIKCKIKAMLYLKEKPSNQIMTRTMMAFSIMKKFYPGLFQIRREYNMSGIYE